MKRVVVFYMILFSVLYVNVLGQKTNSLNELLDQSALLIYDNPDLAIANGLKIIEESNKIDEQITAYRIISDAYSSKRDYVKSLEYVIKANQLLPKSKNALLKISVVIKTAMQYHQLKIYDKALQYLDEGEKLALEYPSPKAVAHDLGICYAVRGFIYKEELNCDIAIDHFIKSITVFENIKVSGNISNRSLANISIVHYNMGNCYLMSNDIEMAKMNFEKSVSEASKIKANSLEAFALKGLAQAYTLEARYKDAIQELENALKISSDVNDLILNQEIYKGLSENYLALNHEIEFNNYHIKYLDTQNQIRLNERKSVSDSLIEKNQILNSQLERVKIKYIFVTLALVLIFIGGMFGFLVIFKKQKKEAIFLKSSIETLQKQ
ncbi:tetratricopeptide repeat protein [Flavobacterium chuncheonense]|uniref:Tetratricopeptide repeat protein n=1 Tax=Flavobacterium chuncheonense TaxID=2026653 RepID=A0ABW5YK39_9FLAO